MIVQRPQDRYDWPVQDLAELRDHARIDFDDDDAGLARMLRAACREAEERGQIALFDQLISVTLDCWPRAQSIRLPIGPLLDFASVTVTADGDPYDDFAVMTGARPELRITGMRPAGQVAISYTAGWGTSSSAIPQDLRNAIIDQAAAYYDARGSLDPKAVPVSAHFTRIVGRYRGVRA